MNGTLITYDGNEFVLQNDLGNGRVERAKLPSGYIPLGIKEYGGIIYVVSYNPITNLSQLGSFPSPERLISSDETTLPDIQILDSDFWEGDGSNGFFSEFYKTGNITEDILRPGDEFLISFGINSGYQTLTELLSVLSHYVSVRDVNNEIINWKKKKLLFNIKLGLVNKDGTIQYIEDNLLKFNITEDAKHWAPLISGDPSQFLYLFKERYENKDLYNIYKENTSGNIILVVELESINDFTVQRSIEVSNNSSDEGIFGVKFLCSSSNNNINSDEYNEKVQLEGVEATFEIVQTDNTDPTQVPFSPIRIKKPISEEKVDFNLEYFKQKLEGTSDILKYMIIPYSKYGKYNRHTKRGTIDFKYVNSGKHFLNEFRYYTGNNTSTISYGLDYYPQEGNSVNEVFMEFYDIANDYSIYHKCRDQDEYSGNFTETIEFADSIDVVYTPKDVDVLKHYYIQHKRNTIREFEGNNRYCVFHQDESEPSRLLPNNLYLVRLCISEKSSEDAPTSSYKYTNFYRFLYTTTLFNQDYLNNINWDFKDLSVKGDLDADITSNINASYEIVDTKSEYYGLYYNIQDYINNKSGYFTGYLKALYTIDDSLKITPKLETPVNTIHKYFGTFNSNSIQVNNVTEIGRSFEYNPIIEGDDSSGITTNLQNLIDNDPDGFEGNRQIDIINGHEFKIKTKFRVNRFVTSDKAEATERISVQNFQEYLSKNFLENNSATDTQKRMFGITSKQGNPVLGNVIATRGGNGAANNSSDVRYGGFFYADLLDETLRYSQEDIDDGLAPQSDLGRMFKDNESYAYREAMQVHLGSKQSYRPNDINSSEFSTGLYKVLDSFNPFKPTIIPLTTFNYTQEPYTSYDKSQIDGVFYSWEKGRDNAFMYSGFSGYHKWKKNGYYKYFPGMREDFNPDYNKRTDRHPIMLVWKTTGKIENSSGESIPRYITTNLYGYRKAPYDSGNTRYEWNTMANDFEIKRITTQKTFSEKVLDILQHFHLVQYENRLFYLLYPNRYRYTANTDDTAKLGLEIKTTKNSQELFTFKWNPQNNVSTDLNFNVNAIKSILDNISFSLDDQLKIDFTNVTIQDQNFNLNVIKKELTYSYGKNISINNILNDFVSGKTGVIDSIKEDVIYITSTGNIVRNPVDTLGIKISPNILYIKHNDAFYDIDKYDFKRLFLDDKTTPASNFFPNTRWGNFHYDLDYYGNFKNIFTTTYASEGMELGKLNEPLIRESVIANPVDDTSTSSLKLTFWDGGGDNKENKNPKGEGFTLLRSLTFDPYYEMFIPAKNTIKPEYNI